MVEIRFPRPKHFRFQAGQFIRIAVRDAGRMQYHPVTISSAPFEDDVTAHFRVLSDWTRRLADKPRRQTDVHVSLQGPFGGFSMDMMSLARQLVHAHYYLAQKRRKIHIVWAVPNSAMTNALPIILMGPVMTKSISKDPSGITLQFTRQLGNRRHGR